MTDDIDKSIQLFEKNPLAQADANPAFLSQRALAVANAVRSIVMACTQKIQGRDYLKVEGWQAIANTYGCVASAGRVEKVDGGWLAHGTVKHLATGMLVSEGEGFVGEDEKMWMGRPLFARRGMAQTRAISRACRASFAFIVPMIDANLQTTPAEEMDHVAEREDPPPRRRAPARAASEDAETVPHDVVTGELLPASPEANDAEIHAAEAKVRAATSQADALAVVNSVPAHVRKRVIQTYREAWVK